MDVKWIKITTDMFDNRKIRHLRRLPDGNNIVLIWVMLLTMAGRCNAGGMIFLTENIPYTPKMLADELDFEESTITLAINALEQLGMVSSDPLRITNWEEYQNVESMEKIREQTRKRMADYRTRKRLGVTSVGENCVYCGKPANTVDHIIPKSKGGKDVAWNLVPCCKLCNSSKSNKDLVDFLNDSFFYAYQGLNHELIQSNEKLMAFVRFDKKHSRYVTVTSSDAPEEEIEEDKEEEIDIYISEEGAIRNSERGKPPAEDPPAPSSDFLPIAKRILEAWNRTGLMRAKRFSMDSERGRKMQALVRELGVETVMEGIEKAGKSEFLKSGTWKVTLDWFLTPDNFQKTLEGQYDERWERHDDDVGGTDGAGGAKAGGSSERGAEESYADYMARRNREAKRKYPGLKDALAQKAAENL